MATKSNNRGPKVVKRSHPRGERGTKISLDEIVKRVEVGRKEPKTVAWAREAIVRAKLGGFKADKMKQAKAILERLRIERPYIEDPVDAEFMPSAACTLDGCEGLTFLGEDCDGLVIAFLSAVEAVGIVGALVAHGYDSSRIHTHVLAAVLDEKRGVWVRCDPSTDDPFGTASKPTRETFVGIPGGKILADNNGPVDTKAVKRADLRPSGDFVGVGRPGMVGDAEPGTTGMTENFKRILRERIRDLTEIAAEKWKQVKFNHRQMELVCEMMGYPLVEPGATEPGTKVEEWTIEAEQYYRNVAKWAPVMIEYGYDASVGNREVFWDDEDKMVLISGRPGEPFVTMNQDGQFVVKNTEAPEKSGSVGFNAWLAGGALVVVGVGIGYFYFDRFMGHIDKQLDIRTRKLDEEFVNDQVDKGATTEEALENLKKLQGVANERARIEIEKEEVSPFAKVTKTAEAALNAVIIVGMAAAAVYGLTLAVDWTKSQQKRAR